MISALVAGILLIAGTAEIYFSYHETRAALLRTQHERAKAAASAIDAFFRNIESQIGWSVHASLLDAKVAAKRRQVDFLRLLRQAPAISDLAYIDASGRERLIISRVSVDTPNSGTDHSNTALFRRARLDGRYLGPVHFRRESEPFMAFALKDQGGGGGVTVAQVNLKFVYDVISQVEGERVFVADSDGLLIAHPDTSLVLSKTNVSGWPQVAAAMAAGPGVTGDGLIAGDPDGRKFLSSHARTDPLGWLVFVEAPLAVAFEPLYYSLIRTGILVVAGVLLSIMAALMLARRITQPIRHLQQGARRIGDGELDQRIEVHTGDELEALADSFNHMGRMLSVSRENVERISMLKRYFSPQIAESILERGQVDLKQSRRREITVVFCDLRNFTNFAATSEPEETMRVLGEYYMVLGKHLRSHEATIGHFAGDGIMAYFNDPMPCEDHAQIAVRMAVGMRADVNHLVAEWRRHGIQLGCGIGIATGYATLGHIGTEDQFHYTAIGSVVNLASRLCEAAADGEILISGTTCAAVEAIVEVKDSGELTMKGFPQPVPTFNVTELRSY